MNQLFLEVILMVYIKTDGVRRPIWNPVMLPSSSLAR